MDALDLLIKLVVDKPPARSILILFALAAVVFALRLLIKQNGDIKIKTVDPWLWIGTAIVLISIFGSGGDDSNTKTKKNSDRGPQETTGSTKK